MVAPERFQARMTTVLWLWRLRCRCVRTQPNLHGRFDSEIGRIESHAIAGWERSPLVWLVGDGCDPEMVQVLSGLQFGSGCLLLGHS